MNLQSVYQTTLEELVIKLGHLSISPSACHYLYRQLFQKGPQALRGDSKIAKRTIEALENNYNLFLPEIVATQEASDGTIKFLLQLQDGQRIESVLLPFHKRFTICLSSQVGCKMGCSFCFTATAGFCRQLQPNEIVSQYLVLYWWAKANRGNYGSIKPNLVFMGQGEPLDNFDSLKCAIQILLQSTGIHLGPRQMTLSSCGLLPQMKRLSELPPINFALSLHSPFEHIRDTLIPINKRYPLSEVLDFIKTLPLSSHQYITFEYMIIPGLTDREEDADELAKKLSQLKAIINLIPFNPFPGCLYPRPNMEEIDSFRDKLVNKHLRVMIRATKGDEILAACGQLRAK